MEHSIRNVRRAARVSACSISFALVCSCGGGVAPSDSENSSGNDNASSGDPTTQGQQPDAPSGGTLTGDNPFRAFIHVTATAAVAAKRGDVPVLIEVKIGRNGSPVVDAIVTAGALGKAVRATAIDGRYVVDEIGYSPWYEVSIESEGAVLKDVRLRAPILHSVSVPTRAVAGQPSFVNWSPSQDPAVDDVRVRVFGWDEQKVTYDDHVVDSGEVELRPTAFPTTGTFVVKVQRATSEALAVPNSVGIVELTSSAETTVR